MIGEFNLKFFLCNFSYLYLFNSIFLHLYLQVFYILLCTVSQVETKCTCKQETQIRVHMFHPVHVISYNIQWQMWFSFPYSFRFFVHFVRLLMCFFIQTEVIFVSNGNSLYVVRVDPS